MRRIGFIFDLQQDGIAATVYRSEPAITIADSSTFAQFLLPIYEDDWDVAGYLEF